MGPRATIGPPLRQGLSRRRARASARLSVRRRSYDALHANGLIALRCCGDPVHRPPPPGGRAAVAAAAPER